MTVIQLDSTALEQRLEQFANTLVDTKPLMQRLAITLLEETEQNFAAQGRPKWAGLNPDYKTRKKGTQILQESGQLAASIKPFHGADYAGVATNKEYAAIHQFGGKTRPHVIRAKNGKALAFNGLVRKSVNHPGSNIPARPFLPMDASGKLQPQALPALEETIDLYLKNALR